MKLLLIALLVGLGSFNLHADVQDAWGHVHDPHACDNNRADRAAFLAQIEHTSVLVTGAESLHIDFNFVFGIVKGIVIVIYGYIWCTRVNPYLMQTKGELGLVWDTPFLKQFSIVCCIVGTIWGFIEGVTTTGPTIHGFGDHLILGLLGAMLGAIAGILANIFPYIVLGMFVLIVMCAAICGINMGFSALLKGFLGLAINSSNIGEEE